MLDYVTWRILAPDPQVPPLARSTPTCCFLSGDQNRAPLFTTGKPPLGRLTLSLPLNSPQSGETSSIAGIVLPIKRAEELLATLPGVVSARIVAGANGAVE